MIWSLKAITVPIFFASGLALLLAVEQFTRKKPNRANLLFSGIFVCLSIIMWGAAAVANWMPPKAPWTIYLFFSAIYFVGPLYYFYLTVLLHPEKKFKTRSVLHFVPAFGTFFIETGFQLLPLEFKIRWLTEMFMQPPKHTLMVLVVIGAAHVFIYLAYLLRMDIGAVWRVKKVRTELRLLVLIDLGAILAVITLYVGFTFKFDYVFYCGGLLLAVITFGVFLGYNRFPDFFQLLKIEIEKKRYEKSSLIGIDTDEINSKLMTLITEEKIYTDSDLNLKGLAEKLSLTPHQLSEYLNERLQKDFRSFINSYRVEAAKKILIEEPEKGILDICYDVGFGSKSTFNTVFKKETGQTPTEFRDATLGSEP